MSDFGSSTPPDPYQPGSGPPPPPPPPYGQAPYGGPPGQGYGQMGGGTPPPNYLVWAILTTIFCCLPLGVASIVFAAQVNGKYAAGDHAGAKNSSDKAKLFAILSTAIGAVGAVIWLIAVAAAD